jgi:hypothetical protein
MVGEVPMLGDDVTVTTPADAHANHAMRGPRPASGSGSAKLPIEVPPRQRQ